MMNRRQEKSIYTQLFIELYYGDEKELKAALDADWLAVQYTWEVYIDGLCRDSLITMEQYKSWVFPWSKRR